MLLRISARQSDLARLQAYQVGEQIQMFFPEIKIQYLFRESLGDKNLNDPLWKMPEKGVFTQDFVTDLIEERTDLIVHSWKDLPIEQNPLTRIAATLKRADPRDLLLFKKDQLLKLEEGTKVKIYSSSPRREYNIAPFLKEHLPYSKSEAEFIPVRGNIQTRVRKLLDDNHIDGLIVAKAAIDRLLSTQQEEFQTTRQFLRSSLEKLQWMVIPLSFSPTAAAQGALAIEVKSSRTDILNILSKINHEPTFIHVQSERSILAGYGGGCHQKIGVTEFEGIRFVKGLPEKKQKIDFEPIHIKELIQTADPVAIETTNQISMLSTNHVFERQLIPVQQVQDSIESENAIFVTHPILADYLENLHLKNKIIWCSGFETWKNIAQKGIWVNGSTEGIMESFGLQIDFLCPDISWAKLAHTGSPQDKMKLISCYTLVEKQVDWDQMALRFKDSQNFYWKSASLFLKAYENWPWLIDKKHFCGFGNTYSEIKKRIPSLDINKVWPMPTHLQKQ